MINHLSITSRKSQIRLHRVVIRESVKQIDLRLGNQESPILDNRMHAILKIRQVH